MSIIDRPAADAKSDLARTVADFALGHHPADTCTLDRRPAFGPSSADDAARVALLLAPDDRGHDLDEPTPAEHLVEPCEDDGPDMGDWWHHLGPDDDLDARWCLTFGGGAGSFPRRTSSGSDLDQCDRPGYYT